MSTVNADATTPSGHLQVVGSRGNRKWRAYWHDADGKHARIIGRAWVKASSRKTARGATIYHAADGPCPEGALTPDRAKDVLNAILAEAPRRAVVTAGAPRTFVETAERWIERARMRGRKPSTLKDYRQTVNAYLSGAPSSRPRLAPVATWVAIPLRDLTLDDLAGWFDEIPPSRTKEKLLMIVRSVLRFAYGRGWVRSNVALALDRDAIEYDERDSYEVDEVERLIVAAEVGPARSVPTVGGRRGERTPRERTHGEALLDLRDAAMYATAAMAGLRTGELLELRWFDVEGDNAVISVQRNYAGGEVVTPKGRSRRRVPMQPALAARLLAWRDVTPWSADSDLVFPNEIGGRQDRSAVRRRYIASAKRAGLSHKPFHALRHHFAKCALAAGADIGKVRDWAGHQDIRTTGGYVRTTTKVADAELLARGWERDELERAVEPERVAA